MLCYLDLKSKYKLLLILPSFTVEKSDDYINRFPSLYQNLLVTGLPIYDEIKEIT